MEQRDYEKLEKMLCKELKEIIDKGELSAGSLETVDKLTHALKNVYKIQMGYEGEYSGEDSYARGRYSRDGESYDSYTSGRRGRSYGDSYGRMSRDSYDGYSGARRGKHYVRGHYSYDDGMDMVRQKIMEMMEGQDIDEHDKKILKNALEVME